MSIWNGLEELFTKNVPCPLCNIDIPVRRTKNDTPYLFCPRCQLKYFVSSMPGIKKFIEKYNNKA